MLLWLTLSALLPEQNLLIWSIVLWVVVVYFAGSLVLGLIVLKHVIMVFGHALLNVVRHLPEYSTQTLIA